VEISRKLYNRLQKAGLKVTDNYSGRFMYGKLCFGITVSQLATALYDVSEALREIIIKEKRDDLNLAKEAADMLEDGNLTDFKTDNMGLDYIVYFPHITVEKENE
jgi:hypothetical protein